MILAGSPETKLTPLEHITSLDTKRWGLVPSQLTSGIITISYEILSYKLSLILQWDRYHRGSAASDGSSEATAWAARGTVMNIYVFSFTVSSVCIPGNPWSCKNLKMGFLGVLPDSKKYATSDRRTGKGPADDVWEAKYGFWQNGKRRQNKCENAWKRFRGIRFPAIKASEKRGMKRKVFQDDRS